MVTGMEGPACLTLDDLHVLPRHRLLRQPCGFEGRMLIRVGAHTHDLAAAQREQHGQGRDSVAILVWRPHWRWLRVNSTTSSPASRTASTSNSRSFHADNH